MRRASLLASAVLCVIAAASSSTGAANIGGSLAAELGKAAPELDPKVLDLALTAVGCADAAGYDGHRVLTVIDYSLPSTSPRLWVFDLERRALLFHELVAHGKNTGENLATDFSNRRGSKQSSLGLFLTAGTYHGKNGYSLKLHGLEEGVNHLALERTIVLHGAWYVSEEFADRQGRLGRSWGCPAVPKDVAKALIDTIKDGTYLFIYYPDADWLSNSKFFSGCGSQAVAPPTPAGSTHGGTASGRGH